MSVCLSLSLSDLLFARVHIPGTTGPDFAKFYVLIIYGRGSVLQSSRGKCPYFEITEFPFNTM